MVRVKAPAKINLSLSILGKLEHFHEVEMIMTTIDLADYVTISKVPEAKEQITVGTNSLALMPGKSNLAYLAADLFLKAYGIEEKVEIQIEKNIPIAGGLAGGSADAAATFRGLRDLFEVDCSDWDLCQLGQQIGSDIPFCIIGKTALATGRGEIITPIRQMPLCWVLIINPRISASTRDIYGAFDLNKKDNIDTNVMLEAIDNHDFDAICDNLANNLEPVTTKIYPIVGDIKKALIKSGANGVIMSGSGPSVFALIYTEKKAKNIYAQMKKRFPNYLVHLARTLG